MLNRKEDGTMRKMSWKAFIFFMLLCCINPCAFAKVKLGIERLLQEEKFLLTGKRVAIITNQTGVDSNLVRDIDRLKEAGINLVKIFSPEHGLYGAVEAGKNVLSVKDEKTGLPVVSLYGSNRRPSREMLRGVDVLLFDIQDVGARFYTYISTMAYAMEGARDAGVKCVVLDRPNPLGGEKVEGPVLEGKWKSFIGLYPIPIRHGMTIGELARLFNEEFGIGADLYVVPMEGWRRDMLFSDTGLVWVPTSPNVPTFSTAIVYPGMGLVGESGVVSVGIGTTLPFEVVGAPWVDEFELADFLNKQGLPGVRFRACRFTPKYGKFQNELCRGVQIHVVEPKIFSPVYTGITLLYALRELYPVEFTLAFRMRQKNFNHAAGTEKLAAALMEGKKPKEIIALWQEELSGFKKLRQKYLLY